MGYKPSRSRIQSALKDVRMARALRTGDPQIRYDACRSRSDPRAGERAGRQPYVDGAKSQAGKPTAGTTHRVVERRKNSAMGIESQAISERLLSGSDNLCIG